MVPDGLDADDFTIDLAVWETGDCRQPGAARLLWVQRHRWQTRFSPFLGVTEPLQVPHTRDMHRSQMPLDGRAQRSESQRVVLSWFSRTASLNAEYLRCRVRTALN